MITRIYEYLTLYRVLGFVCLLISFAEDNNVTIPIFALMLFLTQDTIDEIKKRRIVYIEQNMAKTDKDSQEKELT